MAHSIVHLIGHLDCGGAETVLCRLLEQAGDRRQGMQVATLRGGGELEERIGDMGIPLSRFNFELDRRACSPACRRDSRDLERAPRRTAVSYFEAIDSISHAERSVVFIASRSADRLRRDGRTRVA